MPFEMYTLFKIIKSCTLMVVIYGLALRPRPIPATPRPRPRPVHAKTKTRCSKTKIKTFETRSWSVSRPSPGFETINSGVTSRTCIRQIALSRLSLATFGLADWRQPTVAIRLRHGHRSDHRTQPGWTQNTKVWLETLRNFLAVVCLWSHMLIKSKILVVMNNKNKNLTKKKESYKWLFKTNTIILVVPELLKMKAYFINNFF